MCCNPGGFSWSYLEVGGSKGRWESTHSGEMLQLIVGDKIARDSVIYFVVPCAQCPFFVFLMLKWLHPIFLPIIGPKVVYKSFSLLFLLTSTTCENGCENGWPKVTSMIPGQSRNSHVGLLDLSITLWLLHKCFPNCRPQSLWKEIMGQLSLLATSPFPLPSFAFWKYKILWKQCLPHHTIVTIFFFPAYTCWSLKILSMEISLLWLY